MPVGWIDLETYIPNPNWKYNDPWHQKRLRVPTGEQECPDCKFKAPNTDQVGVHNCPELTDCEGTVYHLGDEVYAYAGSYGIIRGVAEKYKKETENVTVEWIDAPEDERKRRFTIGRRSKILKAGKNGF